MAYDEETGTIGEYTVTDTINHVDETIIHLTINGELLETTAEHPFYTNDGEWVSAGELEVGEQILSLGGVYGTVESVVVIEDANQAMYNLTVEEVHTFTVGDGDWVVHNKTKRSWSTAPRTFTTTSGNSYTIGGYDRLANSSFVSGQGNTRQAHHIIQNAAMLGVQNASNTRRYSQYKAPAIVFNGPSTDAGTEHYLATQSQSHAKPRQGTYATERQIALDSLIAAGVPANDAAEIMAQVDLYFKTDLGLEDSTETNEVKNRPTC